MPIPSTRRRPLILVASLTVLIAALVLCVDRGLGGDTYMDLFTGRFIAEHAGGQPRPLPHRRPWPGMAEPAVALPAPLFWAGWAVG